MEDPNQHKQLKFWLTLHLFKHNANVKHTINIFQNYKMADIRHFKFAYLIAIFATLIDMC